MNGRTAQVYPNAYQSAYPSGFPETTNTQTPWLSRMARWSPFYNMGYGNGAQANGVYPQQQGYNQPGYQVK